ncbi:MAG: hypothetical protein VX278_09010 [Myxococcota bacterium]|nr:hypothetical protein [Myxococcota bacterium]
MSKKEILILLIASFVFAWLWFRPAFWSLAEGSPSFGAGVQSIFFQQSEREMFLGETLDLQGTIWIFHHFDQIIKGNEQSFLPEIYAPIGFDLGKNTGFGWGDALLSWPLIQLLPTPAFYNLHVFLTITLSYFGTALLFRYAKAPLPIAMALAFATCSNTFFRQELMQGRPTQIHWFFHALFLISILALLRNRIRFTWALFGGLVGAWACFVYWFGGVAVGFCGALVLLTAILFRRRRLRRLQSALLLGGTTLFIALILTWRIASQIMSGDGGVLYEAMGAEPAMVLDLWLVQIPIQNFIYLQDWGDFRSIMARSMFPYEILQLVQLAILIPFGWKARWPWLIVGILSMGFLLGPALQWDGGWVLTGYALLQTVFPPLVRCGFNHRMVVAPLLIFGVFLAITFYHLHKRIPYPHVRKAFSLLVAIIIAAPVYKELPNYLNIKTSHMAIDQQLIRATKKWPGGIIHIPIAGGSGNEHIQQMFHKQPILNGPGADTVQPKEHKEYCEQNTILSALEYMAQYEVESIPLYDANDLEELWDDGFRLVYIDTRRAKSSKQIYETFLQADGSQWYSGGQLAIPLPKPKKDQ